jgi:hypothetical protein
MDVESDPGANRAGILNMIPQPTSPPISTDWNKPRITSQVRQHMSRRFDAWSCLAHPISGILGGQPTGTLDHLRRISTTMKPMTSIDPILALLATVAAILVAIFLSRSFNTFMSGKFHWEMKYALLYGVGAMVLLLFMGNAGENFKREHRRAYGMIRIFIGSAILLTFSTN